MNIKSNFIITKKNNVQCAHFTYNKAFVKCHLISNFLVQGNFSFHNNTVFIFQLSVLPIFFSGHICIQIVPLLYFYNIGKKNFMQLLKNMKNTYKHKQVYTQVYMHIKCIHSFNNLNLISPDENYNGLEIVKNMFSLWLEIYYCKYQPFL